MRRFLLLGVLALGGLGLMVGDVHAWGAMPPGVGGSRFKMGRMKGFWLNPSTGRLKDYSTYFAHKYPWLPGAPEYQYNPYGYPPPPAAPVMAPAPLPPGARVLNVAPTRTVETPEPPRSR